MRLLNLRRHEYPLCQELAKIDVIRVSGDISRRVCELLGFFGKLFIEPVFRFFLPLYDSPLLEVDVEVPHNRVEFLRQVLMLRCQLVVLKTKVFQLGHIVLILLRAAVISIILQIFDGKKTIILLVFHALELLLIPVIEIKLLNLYTVSILFVPDFRPQ